MAVLEFGKDGKKNSRYVAELFVLYSAMVLALYVFLSMFSALFIQSDNQFIMGVGAATYIANIYMCHQLPERTLTLFGQHMGLCERCMAIMVGALLAYPAAFWRRRFPAFMLSKWFVLLALIPIGVDGVGQFLGMWESTAAVRVATGFLSAFAILYFLVAEILERFSIGKGFLRRGVVIPALIPFAALVVVVAAISLFVGSQYHSEGEFIQKAMDADRNASFYEAHYIAPHAFSLSIRSDPFLATYNDPVLMDVSSLGTSSHEFGGWAVLALDEPSKHVGKYAFVSGGKGLYYYSDAWSGQLVGARSHGS